eukprot:4772581-Karenia_brevis.AAC.1
MGDDGHGNRRLRHDLVTLGGHSERLHQRVTALELQAANAPHKVKAAQGSHGSSRTARRNG